jgi:hypothetical protein
MKILCRDSEKGDPRYYRFQTELNIGSDDMDNVTATNIAALKQKAKEIIEAQHDAVATLCAELLPVGQARLSPEEERQIEEELTR